MPDSPSLPPVNVLLLGCHGLLGTSFRSVLHEAGNFQVREFSRGEFNLTNPNSFERALGEIEFDVLINAAAYTVSGKRPGTRIARSHLC